MKEMKITIRFPDDRHMNAFVNMLAWMELCGNVGHFTDFLVTMDGDGSARPKFIFENVGIQESFDELKKSYADEELKTIPNCEVSCKIDMRFDIL